MTWERAALVVCVIVIVFLYYTMVRIYVFLRMFKKLNDEHDRRLQRIERDLGIRNWTSDDAQ